MAEKLSLDTFKIVEADKIPDDKISRDAWKLSGTRIIINRDRAIKKRTQRLLDSSTERRKQLCENIILSMESEDEPIQKEKLKNHRNIVDLLGTDPVRVFKGVPTSDIMNYTPSEF